MKTAIVTGASSGIGLEISRLLIQRNYQVFGIGRNFSRCDFKDDLFHPVICNLIQYIKLKETIHSISKHHPIHLLVNNAGTGYFGPHEELSPEKIHEMVSVNLEAPLILTQLLLRDLKKNKGTIINISSVTANKSNPHGCAYGATKSGLTSFTRSLFDEVRKYGVRTAVIHPDMTKTNFYRNAGFHEGETEDTYLTPCEIAQAVEMILDMREGLGVTELTIKPQKHQIQRKKR